MTKDKSTTLSFGPDGQPIRVRKKVQTLSKFDQEHLNYIQHQKEARKRIEHFNVHELGNYK